MRSPQHQGGHRLRGTNRENSDLPLYSSAKQLAGRSLNSTSRWDVPLCLQSLIAGTQTKGHIEWLCIGIADHDNMVLSFALINIKQGGIGRSGRSDGCFADQNA